ncbi:MAG: hypothetical protein OEV40_00650 [Acidimicrobiia bacterium]|nr:hypothetical protein [Acidimicrobiia bacterium]
MATDQSGARPQPSSALTADRSWMPYTARIPLGALFAPLGSAVLTGLAGVVATVFSRPPTSG